MRTVELHADKCISLIALSEDFELPEFILHHNQFYKLDGSAYEATDESSETFYDTATQSMVQGASDDSHFT